VRQCFATPGGQGSLRPCRRSRCVAISLDCATSNSSRPRRDVILRFVDVRNRHGAKIGTVEEWGQLAAPAAKEHWKDGRSAKELAKSWISGVGSQSLGELFDSLERTRDLQIANGIAEAQISFDKFPGGKRNHDLLIHGACAAGPVVIGLEAKADETFGQTVATYLRDALALRNDGRTTNAPERLANLLKDVAGTSLTQNSNLGNLRYQLFSGVAGTLAAAHDGEFAAFIVHEFATELTTKKKRLENKTALGEFVSALTGIVPPAGDWWLLGPFKMPAERWSHTPLYIGHLTTTNAEA
jgi:hypothetical protein